MSCHHGAIGLRREGEKLVNNRVIIYLSKLIAEAKGVFDQNSRVGIVQLLHHLQERFSVLPGIGSHQLWMKNKG